MSTTSLVAPVSSGIFWRQVLALTRANLKSRYRKTIAGFLWVILNPLILYSVQSLVFQKFLGFKTPRYALFLGAGLLPWIFISQALEMCTSLFVVNGRMLRSFQINPLVFLFSQLADNLLNFLAAFLLVILPLRFFWNDGQENDVLLLLPVPILLLALGTTGMASCLATLQVFFRDTRFLVSFALNVSFFLTPIFYPIELVPPSFRIFIEVNPFYRLISPFQVLLHDYSAERLGLSLFFASGVACGTIGLASLLWERKRNALYLNV